ncbi:unnamed protein product [Lepeophtheirus salmonis]|uniref:(salmon louse) hypothetical protein n=1 Tax=Lepeophtheirus salmonis TaxID=72036 RepID=A0A7R8CAT4_LEPSM|nr:unnamed protein product [Lepeophtheirus salmonis]CAF2752796.1 unnamed protein product [Lepeophtheirus salmonis]
MVLFFIRIWIFVQFTYYTQCLVNESDERNLFSDESKSSKNGSYYLPDGDSNRRQLISNYGSIVQLLNPTKEKKDTFSSEIEASFRSSDPEPYGIMNFNQWLQASLFTQYDTPMDPISPSVHERSNSKYSNLPTPSPLLDSSISLTYQTPPPPPYSTNHLKEIHEPEPERKRNNEAYILDQHQEILNLLHIVTPRKNMFLSG